MSYGFLDIAATPSVQAVQTKMGADRIWRNFKGHREFDRFGANEARDDPQLSGEARANLPASTRKV
jgi:hypothetical protein